MAAVTPGGRRPKTLVNTVYIFQTESSLDSRRILRRNTRVFEAGLAGTVV